MATTTGPTLAEIQEARRRLEGVARATPVISSETIGRLAGRSVWLKAENLQRTGSFKIRGAYNRISTLTDAERAAGVVTASAGNHGQAVAWAARQAGVRATDFMPEDAPTAKMEATKSWIEGVAFPATKLALIDSASDSDAPQELVERLQRLQREQYGSREQLEAELGDVA